MLNLTYLNRQRGAGKMNKKFYCKVCKRNSIISLPEEVFECITHKALESLLCNDCTNEKLESDFDYMHSNYELNVI